MGFIRLNFTTGKFPFFCRFTGIFSLSAKDSVALD